MPTPQQQYQAQLGNAAAVAASARSSWDLSNYLENGSATAAGTSGTGVDYQGQGQQHQTPRNVVDGSMTGGGNGNRALSSLQHQQQSQQIPRT